MKLYPIYRHWNLQTKLLCNIAIWHYKNCYLLHYIVILFSIIVLQVGMTISCISLYLNPRCETAVTAPQWFIRPVFKFVHKGIKLKGDEYESTWYASTVEDGSS